MDQNQHLNKTAEAQSSGKRRTRRSCDGFKMFLAALAFSFICKALGGVTMKSSITQIERRFDISSSVAGLIDGGFEIGNLLVIVFVSYYGSKLNRPKIIGIGCVIMGTGGILTALPHFFMGYYRYSSETHIDLTENSTLTCSLNQTLSLTGTSPEINGKGCAKETESSMWIYVLMGNMLRGIGETPIMPLGISYIDDFAKEGHSSLYLGGLNAIAMIGPILGFVMSSLFAQMYVDIGYVDLSSIRITPKDSRWVGAWWLGFLVSGLLSIMSSIPFFFLPNNSKNPQKGRKLSTTSHMLKTNEEKNQTASMTNRGQNDGNITGFFQSLKLLLTNHLYILYLMMTLLYFSSFIGTFTYLFKYIEQQYGQTASQANFLFGIITLPMIALGMFSGGYIIKKFKLTLVGIAKFSFFTCIMSFSFQLLNYGLMCENKPVAGLTLTYDGISPVASPMDAPLPYCNSDCNCDVSHWEPVCGANGITYTSPCLAGCLSSGGNAKSTVFYNCSCVEVSSYQNRNYSARLGECPRNEDCKKKYYFHIGVQVINSFFSALGSSSNMMLAMKNVQPELKSLAMGFHALTIRTLGGILAPIYFGALIDRTCLKWSIKSCGAKGACRLYDSLLLGRSYWGMSSALKFGALIFYVSLIYSMKRKYERKDAKVSENGGKAMDEAILEPLSGNGHCSPSAPGPFTENSYTLCDGKMNPLKNL